MEYPNKKFTGHQTEELKENIWRKVSLFSKKAFNMGMQPFYRGVRNACRTMLSISNICCILDKFYLLHV
jgi:hypothetical protein